MTGKKEVMESPLLKRKTCVVTRLDLFCIIEKCHPLHIQIFHEIPDTHVIPKQTRPLFGDFDLWSRAAKDFHLFESS